MMSPDAKRAFVERFLRAFGSRALVLYRRFAEGAPDRRCRSCAFREMERRGVDGWKGWQASLNGLLLSAGAPLSKEIKPRVFVCHLSRRKEGAWAPHAVPRFCAGYAVLAGRPEFAQAVCDAAVEAEAGA